MKNSLPKILVVVGVFVVATIVTILVTRSSSQEDVSYTVLEDSALPVLTLSSNGVKINTLNGYLKEPDIGEAQESLTPVGTDGKIALTISNFGNAITGINYEVRSIDGENLIENTSLETWEDGESEVTATLPIKDIIDEDTEYRLTIFLSTEKLSNISYYTRLVKSSTYKEKEMIEYVRDFHDATFSAKSAKSYAVNWEPNDQADNESLAYVDIHSSFTQLTYASLAPTQVGEADITVLEMDKTFGSFKVTFKLQALDENGETSYYLAEEYFNVQWSQTRFYLMSYARTMTQIFDANEETVSEKGLNFGVISKDDIDVTKSEEGTYLTFVQAGTLWSYSNSEGEITEIFSLSEGQETIRQISDDYKIKVASVSDNGDVNFLVYGYMSRGAHEGENGLSYYTYNREANTLSEITYIASGHSCEVIDAEVSTLCTMQNGLFYFICDDTLYAIDSSGPEIVKVVSGVNEHKVRVNDAKDTIAWISDGADGRASEIQIKYLDSAKTRVIKAGAGEYVVPCGFIERDFVTAYGKTDQISASGLEEIEPWYMLTITDADGKELKRYEQSGMVITGAVVEDGKVTIERKTVSGNTYKNADDDILMQSNKEVVSEANEFASEKLELRERVYLLEFSGEDYHSLKKLSPSQVSSCEASAGAEAGAQVMFYAYAKGHLEGVYEEAGSAISAVYDEMGSVVDSDGYRIWHRKGKDTKQFISIPADAATVKSSSELAETFSIMLKMAGSSEDGAALLSKGASVEASLGMVLDATVLDLDGCTIKQLLYFIDKKEPVIAMDNAGKTYLIIGYDSWNIMLYDRTCQGSYKLGMEDAQSKLEEGQWHLLSFVKH